jgi:hypothetical protein
VFHAACRSSSLEPEGSPSCKNKLREHIIPIHVERDTVFSSAPARPPVPPVQQQRSASRRYLPHTSAYIQQISRAMLCGSFPLEVITCIGIMYLMGTYSYKQVLVVRKLMKIQY